MLRRERSLISPYVSRADDGNRYYDINHVLVSIIFLGNAFGFISAALIIHFLVSKVGNARTLMIAEGLKLAAYVILVSTPPIYMVMIA